jgi:hypothetical protein
MGKNYVGNRKYLFVVEGAKLIEVNIDMGNCTHELWAQIQELKGELETLHKAPDKASQPTSMDNWLKEFEELLLDNALLKV